MGIIRWALPVSLLAACAPSPVVDVGDLAVRSCGADVTAVEGSRDADVLLTLRGQLAGSEVRLQSGASYGPGAVLETRATADGGLHVLMPTGFKPGPHVLSVANDEHCDLVAVLQGEPGTLEVTGGELVEAVNTALRDDPALKLRGALAGDRISTVAVEVHAGSALARDIVVNGNSALLGDNPAESIYLAVIDLVDHAVLDVVLTGEFTTNQAYTGFEGAEALAATIRSLSDDQLVVLASTSGIRRMAISANLADAIASIGGSALFSSIDDDAAYALIGRPGAGRGNGLERIAGTAAGTARLATVVVDKGVLGFGSTPSQTSGGGAEDVDCEQCVGAHNIVDGAIDTSHLGDAGCDEGEHIAWLNGAWRCATGAGYTGADFAISSQVCPDGGLVSGIDASGDVVCDEAVGDEDTTYSGADFALSNQACPESESAVGFDDNGVVQCAPDLGAVLGNAIEGAELELATLEPRHLARNGCAGGQILKWNGSSWACAADADTDTLYDGGTFALSNQACPPGDRVVGINAAGRVVCAADTDTQYTGTTFALSDQACEADEIAVGFDALGNIVCGTDAGGAAAGDGIVIVGDEVSSVLGATITSNEIVNGAIRFSHINQNGCSQGEIPKWAGTAWTCRADSSTAYTGGAGVNIGGGVISATLGDSIESAEIVDRSILFSHLAASGCTAGQLLKWDGLAWTCGTDAAAPFSPGDGVQQSGNTLSTDLPTTITSNEIEDGSLLPQNFAANLAGSVTAGGPASSIQCASGACVEDEEIQSVSFDKVRNVPVGLRAVLFSKVEICPGILVNGVCLVQYDARSQTDWSTAVNSCNQADAQLCSHSQYYTMRTEYNSDYHLWYSNRAVWTDDFSDNDGSRMPYLHSSDDPSKQQQYSYGCCHNVTPEPFRSRTQTWPSLDSTDGKGVQTTYLYEHEEMTWRAAAKICTEVGSDLCSKSQYITLKDNGLFQNTPRVWTNEMSDNDSAYFDDIVGVTGSNPGWSNEWAFACCANQRPIDNSCTGTAYGSVCTTQIEDSNDYSFYDAARACAADGADVCTKYEMQVLRNFGAVTQMAWTADGADNDSNRTGGLLSTQIDDPHPETGRYGYACCL